MFGLSIPGNEYHPPSDVTPAERLLALIHESLRANVAAWNTTLFLIMFDEHGGTYDHVPPPPAVAPWGDVPPNVSKGLQYDFDFRRLGVRVPAIAVSPLIEAKTVFRSPGAQPFDHTSMIATVLEWMLPPGVERSTWGLGERVNAAPTFDGLVTRGEPRTADALVPPTPVSDAIRYGDAIVLVHMGGPQAISAAYTGVADYYPTLAEGAPQRLDFRNGCGDVHTVQRASCRDVGGVNIFVPRAGTLRGIVEPRAKSARRHPARAASSRSSWASVGRPLPVYSTRVAV